MKPLSPQPGSDPRLAKSLEEACSNGDGTYNGARMLSWLSEAVNPGHGVSLAVVEATVAVVSAISKESKILESGVLAIPFSEGGGGDASARRIAKIIEQYGHQARAIDYGCCVVWFEKRDLSHVKRKIYRGEWLTLCGGDIGVASDIRVREESVGRGPTN